MPKFIVSKTSTQQIAIEAENAQVAENAAAAGQGDVISSNTSYNARPDRRPEATAPRVTPKPATIPPVPPPAPAEAEDKPAEEKAADAQAVVKPATSSKTSRAEAGRADRTESKSPAADTQS